MWEGAYVEDVEKMISEQESWQSVDNVVLCIEAMICDPKNCTGLKIMMNETNRII